MKYRLKKGSSPYEVVDGPLAGRRYSHEKDYSVIPAADADKFEAARENSVVRIQDPEAGQGEDTSSTKSTPSTKKTEDRSGKREDRIQ